MEGLLGIINDAYTHYEENHKLLQRALELSSIELNQAKNKISVALSQLNEKNDDLLSSIHYARLIQEAILPSEDRFRSVLQDAFVYHKPRDIVSGDFYWLQEYEGTILVAAVDCTGHGVPGGFMSIVANNLLQQAIKQVGLTKPSEILDYASHGITNTLHQTYEESSVKDGMDVAICCWNEKNMTLEYAGAYNPLYIFREGELLETKANRFPVGTFIGEQITAFENHKIKVQKGDIVYVFTDGYADQFGGPNGKKFMMNRFRKLLLEIHIKPMNEQHDLLDKTFKKWKGNLDQVDDICILAVRIT